MGRSRGAHEAGRQKSAKKDATRAASVAKPELIPKQGDEVVKEEEFTVPAGRIWAPLDKCGRAQRQSSSRFATASDGLPARQLRRAAAFRNVIFVIHDFFLAGECAEWIDFGERLGFMAADVPKGPGYAYRDNSRIELNAADVAAAVFRRLCPLLPADIDGRQPASCAANVRLYKYQPQQRFGRHIDESHDNDRGERSVFTVLVYLNDEDLVGGETVFYKSSREVVRFVPRAGSLLLHRHGHKCLEHEAVAVRQGVKYVFRTDVCYARGKI